MAKIGNETRLILKLAESRKESRLARIRAQSKDPKWADFIDGVKRGMEEYEKLLQEIVAEVEER